MNICKNGITLRAICQQDAPVLLEMINDGEIENAVVGWSFPVSMTDQLKWIESVRGDQRTCVRYAIDMGEGIVGVAALSSLDLKNRTANLNIKLLRAARGQGIACRAMQMLIGYCFEELNLHCVTANVISENEASNGLFTRLGFHRDGLLRDRVFKADRYHDLVAYSMLREEYDARDWQ